MSGLNWKKARDDKRIREQGSQPHEDLLPRSQGGQTSRGPEDMVKKKKKRRAAADALLKQKRQLEKKARKAEIAKQNEARRLEKKERRKAEAIRQQAAREEKEAKRKKKIEDRKSDPKAIERAEMYRQKILDRMSRIKIEKRSSKGKKIVKPDSNS